MLPNRMVLSRQVDDGIAALRNYRSLKDFSKNI